MFQIIAECSVILLLLTMAKISGESSDERRGVAGGWESCRDILCPNVIQCQDEMCKDIILRIKVEFNTNGGGARLIKEPKQSDD